MPDDLLGIEEARSEVLAAARRLPVEQVALENALGRVLAEDVSALGDVPPFANSAMDGFAVRAGAGGRTLTVGGESRAGAPAEQPLAADAAIRIATGAPLPAGAEGVLPIERVQEQGDHVLLEAPVSAGQNVRLPGEDMRAGELVLAVGTRH
jgi:molybdopterin molybdotransferase